MSEQSSSNAANSSNLDIVEPGDAVARLRSSTAKRVAVFLGAGASRTFGYPLTSQILPDILDRLSDPAFLTPLDDPRPADEYRNVLRRYLFELMPGKERRRDNLPLVTSLLSLLDFSVATGQSVLPSSSAQETREARRLLERAILEVIADEDPFGATEGILLERFYELLADLWTRGGERLDVVTTNYDLAADESVFEAVQIKSYSGSPSGRGSRARRSSSCTARPTGSSARCATTSTSTPTWRSGNRRTAAPPTSSTPVIARARSSRPRSSHLRSSGRCASRIS
jgi:hypothetical protein